MPVTRNRDLRTGIPVWQQWGVRVPKVRRWLARGPVEILVVGAGVSGALLAHRLAQRGHQVAIVDRRGLVRGSTPASTALLQFEIDTPLLHLSRQIGRRDAVRAWEYSAAAVQALHRLVIDERLPIVCKRRATAYLAGDVLGARDLQREAALRASVGLPSEWFDRRALRRRFGLHRSGAIVSDGNLELNPRAFTAAVLRAAVGHGARCYAPCEVVEVRESRRHVIAATLAGPEIAAQAVMFCTGYELPTVVPAQGHRIGSTWVIATRPQAKRLWPERCFIWEASDPYLYARTTPDGRVICGGEDEKFSDAAHRDALLPAKTATLERKLAALVPGVSTAARYAWTGSFGDSDNGLPTIGRIPGYRRLFAVMGYGGNGITFSMLAARLVTAEWEGNPDAGARLFAFR